ncbi:MAG: protein translocase subunit SecD [Lentisphaerae bacterium]|jgi:SecD/SecF fusion protein|nr:protein translocase subunit SecD [Lentisphaerota bacterium]
MKKSLIIRWSIILVVIVAWTWSIFPITDRDYLSEFQKMAKKQVAKLAREAEQVPLVTQAEELKIKLEQISDKESEEYKQLAEQHQKLTSSKEYIEQSKKPENESRKAYADYQELLRRIAKIQSEDSKVSGYKAVEWAADGDSDHYRIGLGNFIRIPLQGKASNKTVLRYVRIKSAGKLNLGLDLKGGTEFIVGFDASKLRPGERAEEVRDRVLEILRNRLDNLGVTEPEIKAITSDSISIRMPSVDEADKSDIRHTIKQSARLQFHLVAINNNELVSQYNADPRAFHTPAHLLRKEIEEERNGELHTEILFIEKNPEMIKGEDVDRAVPNVNQFGNWSISLRFNAKGAAAFADVTGKNVGRRLAIVLDDRVYSAPNIREAITGGQAEISGSFTVEEARRLSGVIASGNLPVSIEITSEFGTEPSLGVDSIHSGAMAGIFGLFLVVLMMLWYYKFSGFVAVLALIVNGLLVIGTMAITKATITMPGIAGMVLTIGMAVDANVLIFERFREELAKGKSLAASVKAGYERVFSCILDSNLTTLITCIFLYKYGSGSVRGFAVTLTFGIVASMFTALFMTHAIFDLMIEKGWLKTLSMRTMKLFQNTQIDFFKYSRPIIIASIILTVISLLSVVVRRDTVLGIDFSGGTQLTYACEGEAPDVESIRAWLDSQGQERVRVGYKRGQGGTRELEIVIPKMTSDPGEFGQALDAAFPECKMTHTSTYSVGGSVGSKFRNDTLLASFLSFIAIIIYLSFRFEFVYGMAAVVAVIHDVIVSAGLFFILHQGELSLTVVAALMTIIGYSLNDTIVIFDRIRELRPMRKDLSYQELVNVSINQTLSRTILTSVTTMLAVISLLIFGGGVIFDFAIVMFYGMITGTYSTIFIASSIVNYWHRNENKKPYEVKAAAAPAKAK